MSFKPEVTTAGSDQFVPNGLAFASAEEAQAYVADLADRWTAVPEPPRRVPRPC